MTLRPPLSAYIRAKNEARMIGDVVRAALAVVDEVVVVDSGSTDGTPQIAEDSGARVVHQHWLGNGHQKRIGENACRHDWVFDLDADEIVTPALAEEISALFANGAPPLPIYTVRLVTAPPLGKPWRRIAVACRRKLYDRRVVRAPDHAVWDQFEAPKGVAVGALSAPLLHYSFRDFEHFMSKLNRISTVRAQESRLKPMWVVALRVVAAPPLYFIKHYLLRGLWRAGLYGMAIAGMSAHGRWLRDVKMLEIHLRQKEARDGGR